FGNYMRPTMVMVNLMLVNPLNNITMVLVWAGAGFVGGMMAGTKKGAFVVGLVTWLSCFGLIVLCGYLLLQGGFALGEIVVPPGESIAYILSIPLISGAIEQILPLISGLGGGLDIMALLTPLIIWFLTPVIIVIIAAILGAVVRKKEAL
ncbi:MAG: hypothetical protein C4K48_11185, partial [Candidatus Thorarchaeota archaeon]